MSDLVFFRSLVPLSLGVLSRHVGCVPPREADATRIFRSVAFLDRAGPDDVAFATGEPDRALASTRAGACFVKADRARLLPTMTIALVAEDPGEAFQRIAALLHPDSVVPRSAFGRFGIDPAAIVHGDARLEPGINIDPGVVVGPHVEIGAGTVVGANSVIGVGVRIGRGCSIDAQVSISNALIGDRVTIHAGARIGQGGPDLVAAIGFRPAYLGRVIIQDDVEIGANATIERGRMGDTVIGEGSRIEALAIVRRDTSIDRHQRLGRAAS